MPTWTAEVVVGEDLVRGLLGQFPQLTVDSVRPLAEGWDRGVWLVNERWAFGFPRRAMGVPGIEREIDVLPRLAPLLSVRIPEPEFVGRPTDEFPWPFSGARFIAGREAGDAVLDDAARVEVAIELARLLRRLHAAEVAEAVDPGHDLPVDPNARMDMPKRVQHVREDLADVQRLGLWRRPERLDGLLEEAEVLPPSTEPTAVVHGDLHFRHLLVDDEGGLCGVIDWNDVCRADPAIDLQLAWSFFPPEDRERFYEAYGPVTEEQRLRARVLALSLCAALARYGEAERLPEIVQEAVGGLERALSD